jgi:hypothetical protein
MVPDSLHVSCPSRGFLSFCRSIEAHFPICHGSGAAKYVVKNP